MEKVAVFTPFNGSFETGVRLVFLLLAHYPVALDLNRLTALDHLVVRTSLLDTGQKDLHPPTPILSPVTQVKRKSVQAAISLMMSRGLVEQVIQPDGIYYQAGDNSAFFVNALQTPYLQQLRHCAEWISNYFENYTDDEFDDLVRGMLRNWVSEFQDETAGMI